VPLSPAKQRVACRAYYAKNREAILAQKRTEYAALPDADRGARLERCRQVSRVWYQRNRERELRRQTDRIAADPQAWRDKQTRWRRKHPETYRAQYRRRRALQRKAEGSHTADQWLSRIHFYGWRCFYCHLELTPRTVTQDHVKPVSHGGSEWPANLVPACAKCNRRKWDSSWRDALANLRVAA